MRLITGVFLTLVTLILVSALMGWDNLYGISSLTLLLYLAYLMLKSLLRD